MKKKTTSQEIRRRFLQYFRDHQHSVIASSPVIPHEDPTLLFTNAGMNQFKDVFLGTAKRDYTRATTCQKCIRAGGKHNDLDNVGHTSRHMTFFEMLGNFSFGDYFKEDAIKFGWEVSTEVFQLPPERLWPTVFTDDDEAFELWTRYVPAERITRFGKADNFWAMGETGPCGPCSEILYDRGEAWGKGNNPTEDAKISGGERFLEFWNHVFMQYNRGTDGKMIPLPRPSIDTGAGLERCVALMQGVDSVFETDILRAIIDAFSKQVKIPYDSKKHPETAAAFNVIADHLRSLSFAIADGAQPSNLDRGYVLRKILRRAVRYGRQLADLERPFMADLLPILIEQMGADYPELVAAQNRIAEVLTVEEESFQRTLRRGQNMLGGIIEVATRHGRHITGDDAFKLKDTYGFPLDEILLIAKDAGLDVDVTRFQTLEEEAKERSRATQKTTHQICGESVFTEYVKTHEPCQFVGYTEPTSQARISGIVIDCKFVEEAAPGQEAAVILDKTPFYASMGGQVGDTGILQEENVVFTVTDTVSPYPGVIAHMGQVAKGTLHVGDTITAQIDTDRRQKIANNHTATHVLHWALHKVLGDHVKQAGSVVDDERLRFDFSHHKAMTPEEIRQVEDLVNTRIRGNVPVKAYTLAYEEAQKRRDIKQFFGDKYGSNVRVIDIDYSKELCGGTHTSHLGNIGLFRILKEGSIAAGIRRIEAVTGAAAEFLAREDEDELSLLAQTLKAKPRKLQERVEKLLEENKNLALEIERLHSERTGSMVLGLIGSAETVQGVKLVVAKVDIGIDALKGAVEQALAALHSGVVVLGCGDDTRCQIAAAVSEDVVRSGISAKNIVAAIAPLVDGRGGGKDVFAQAGGKDTSRLPQALAAVKETLIAQQRKKS